LPLNMYRILRVLRKSYGDYCVENRNCNTKEEVYRFYRRMGIYIFIFYLLESNDIHGENMIACGEYPVIVDMENMLSMSDDIKCSTIMEKMKLFLHTSVFYSGVLSGLKW
jgi:lantibiotic modifying enzyme